MVGYGRKTRGVNGRKSAAWNSPPYLKTNLPPPLTFYTFMDILSTKVIMYNPDEMKPTPTNVMLDIETLGTAPGSVITSIGAVKFGNGKILDRFFIRIDLQSCLTAGLKMDAETVLWWLRQPEASRGMLTLPGIPLGSALLDFRQWVSDPKAEIWGNGATFDNVLLAGAYNAATITRPWSNFGDRCYRTVKNAHRDLPIDSFRIGTHHNAVDDAESQALHLMAIWDREDRQRRALALLTDLVAVPPAIREEVDDLIAKAAKILGN